MGTAGDLRALVTAAPAGLRTLRGALTTWVQRDLVAAAHARRPALAPGSPPGDQGPEVLASWYVVVAPPDRWRVVGRGHLAVSDGERSWVGTSTLVTERPPTRASIHDGGVVGSCIHPAPLLEGLELGAPADDEIAGRPCWVVRARPADPAARAGPQPLLHRDLAGVEHRLWFDRATGIMLRHEGYAAGRMCSWLALTDLVVDAPVDDREFRPPPGAVVRSHHELLRDHLAGMGIDPDTVDLDDPVQVRAALRQGA